MFLRFDGGRMASGYPDCDDRYDSIERAVAICAAITLEELVGGGSYVRAAIGLDGSKSRQRRESTAVSSSTRSTNRAMDRYVRWPVTPTLRIGSRARTYLDADSLPTGLNLLRLTRYHTVHYGSIVRGTRRGLLVDLKEFDLETPPTVHRIYRIPNPDPRVINYLRTQARQRATQLL